MPDELEQLQRWYAEQCNGDWEHQYGVTIDTLDNPGWQVKIDLLETRVHDRPFAELSVDRDEQDWIRLKVEGGVFHGHGGARNLREILAHFLKWVDQK